MTSDSWLWYHLHDLFETDDGSLPEIRIDYSKSSSTIAGFKLLRRRANRVVTENASFWSKRLNSTQPLDSIPNAAELVVAGDAEPFHVVFSGIRARESVIPDLGVFVFPDQLALDYRMGPDWGAPELESLFDLLVDLTTLDSKARVSLGDDVLPEVASRFQQAWQRWLTEHAA